MFEPLTSNLWIIAPSLWVCFIVYVVWYSSKAKDYAPLTHTEARTLWVIHQQNSRCGSKKWRQVRKQGTTVGFECGCGHKHVQLRPIAAHVPSTPVQLQTTAFNTAEPPNRTS